MLFCNKFECQLLARKINFISKNCTKNVYELKNKKSCTIHFPKREISIHLNIFAGNPIFAARKNISKDDKKRVID